MKINSRDITLVFQGKIKYEYITRGISAARKFFPEAEIIISTWDGEKISPNVAEQCDKILFNKDPGGMVFCKDGSIQNHNRQIVSTLSGVSSATRKYVMKLRSDILILGDEFLKFYSVYRKRHKEFKLFKERVLINSYCTNDSRGRCPCLFHPSDWVAFGLKEDILKLWDIPLSESTMSRYFELNPERSNPNENLLARWHSEQYIWLSCLNKNGYKVNFDTWFSYSSHLARQSDIALVNNFVVLDYKTQMSLVSQKYPVVDNGAGILKHSDWLYLYNKYIDSHIDVPCKTKIIYGLGLKPYEDRLRKIVYRLFLMR